MTTDDTKANAEEVYGEELLTEVAALTWGLRARKDDLLAFSSRAQRAVKAQEEAHVRARGVVELDDDLSARSGFGAFAGLAQEVGLYDALFEGGRWAALPDAPPQLPSVGPWSVPGGGLSPAQLDALVDTVEGAEMTIINAMHAALEEAGHRTGHRPPEWGPGLEPCVVCHQPWPCPPVDRVLRATRGLKKAMLALGANRDVIENADTRHRSAVTS